MKYLVRALVFALTLSLSPLAFSAESTTDHPVAAMDAAISKSKKNSEHSISPESAKKTPKKTEKKKTTKAKKCNPKKSKPCGAACISLKRTCRK